MIQLNHYYFGYNTIQTYLRDIIHLCVCMSNLVHHMLWNWIQSVRSLIEGSWQVTHICNGKCL